LVHQIFSLAGRVLALAFGAGNRLLSVRLAASILRGYRRQTVFPASREARRASRGSFGAGKLWRGSATATIIVRKRNSNNNSTYHGVLRWRTDQTTVFASGLDLTDATGLPPRNYALLQQLGATHRKAAAKTPIATTTNEEEEGPSAKERPTGL